MVAADSTLPTSCKACPKIVGYVYENFKTTEATDIAERMLQTYFG